MVSEISRLFLKIARLLMTATAERNHLVVLFQDDVLLVVEVQETDGVQLVGYTAWRVDRRRTPVPTHRVAAASAADAQGVDDALDGGVVRRMLVLTEREWTLAAALVGVVPLGRDDPARPADPLEVDVHFVPLTCAPATSDQRSALALCGRCVDEALVG